MIVDNYKGILPDHPCRHCLKRPTCESRCLDYWYLAYDLRENHPHILADSSDKLLFRYLTMDRRVMPSMDLHSLPGDREEIKHWMINF